MWFIELVKGFLGSLLKPKDYAWWVKIDTIKPHCTYYFGPFNSPQEARQAQSGYADDLAHEGAEGIKVQVEWCKPTQLTIYHDEPEGLAN